jgi:hypothetical protein
VNISSVGGRISTPIGAWYHATEHALEAGPTRKVADVTRASYESGGGSPAFHSWTGQSPERVRAAAT